MCPDDYTILHNPDALGEDYLPYAILGRDEEIERIRFCLLPALKREKPIHAWIFGTPGCGKTATVKYLLKALEKETSVGSIYINCWEDNTFYAIMDRIIRERRILRAEKLNTTFKLEKFAESVSDRPFIIVLDEIDRLSPKERNSTLYNLCNVGNVGLVCICSNEFTYFGLEERVKSRLNPTRIEFRAYHPDQLTEILRHRAEQALKPGSWEHSILAGTAELSKGDARVAIQTLKNASYIAIQENEKAIREHHVRMGWNSAKSLRKSFLLAELTEHHRILYRLVEKHAPVNSGELWGLYRNECHRVSEKPIAIRTYSLYMNRLAALGIVKAERARVRGRVRSFSPARSPFNCKNSKPFQQQHF